MSQGDQDKTEQPTPYRLEEARKRGEVAKSPDISSLVVMITFAAIVALTGGSVALALAGATRRMIALSGNAPSLDAAFAQWATHVYGPVGQAIAPLIIGLLVAAVLGNVLQTGPMFTTHPLKPDFKRMNPAAVFKRLFSMRTLWELGKLMAKLAALCALCVWVVWKSRALVESVAATLPQRVGDLVLSTFVRTSLYVLLVLGLISVLDLLFARRDFMRRMRMSRRELKDEVKRRDGDPAVRSKQRQQLRDLLKKTKALGRVREADVVLTNPTHVAIALRYDPGKSLAPVVLAKGAGVLAARIRTLAVRHRVPIRRVPSLARALYRDCAIDGHVLEAHYVQLAPVYRALWAERQGAAA